MSARKKICAAVLAHVDAGKTTLSEALLYVSGSIKKAGRVDNGDAFLDHYELERRRGITIFSKQARFSYRDLDVTLLDTPGHVDFSAEMERTLSVLDYAILVVSGSDGVQAHTETLMRLLKRYEIPVFLFVNKMDQSGAVKERLLTELGEKLDENCVDFTEAGNGQFYEAVAMCGEEALDYYLEHGTLPNKIIADLIAERRLFPCFFGSALKMEGVEEFLTAFCEGVRMPEYPAEFGAKAFKVARDGQGTRLTFLKITGGSLKVKMPLSGHGRKHPGDPGADYREEKVNQIRIYNGQKYETSETAEAGTICAVTGPSETFPGESFGIEEASLPPVLEPVLTCRLQFPEGTDAALMLPKLRLLEEEEPELHLVWNSGLKEIQAQIMGEIQVDILKSRIQERFGTEAEFGPANIVYKETILDTVEGVGHYEPLRHYAEVHLLLEPGDPGSGLVLAADCSEEILEPNWQRLVLTHLEEKEHRGVLAGAPITDMKITLKAGRAHRKHTEGGDFRQAAYRAVRHGLMQARSVLLEPYYEFQLLIPEDMVGRAMTDIERLCGTIDFHAMPAQPAQKGRSPFTPEYSGGEPSANEEAAGGKLRLLKGSAPAATMQDYQKEVLAYTKGRGRLAFTPAGYRPCHNEEEALTRMGYDPERDQENPAGSVFCAHGAGFSVGWEHVADYMHVESCLKKRQEEAETWSPQKYMPPPQSRTETRTIGTDEIDRILKQTYNANKRDKALPQGNHYQLRGRGGSGGSVPAVTRSFQPKAPQDEYLLVDGYNIIFAWEELKALAAVSIDGARGRLLDILSNYQGIRGCRLIVVFDAYRVEGHRTEALEYHNIRVVYTKEAETADQYIEKFAHENGRKYRVTVATSDGLEQIIIRGAGCALLSAGDLLEEVTRENMKLLELYQSKKEKSRNYLFDGKNGARIKDAVKGQEPQE